MGRTADICPGIPEKKYFNNHGDTIKSKDESLISHSDIKTNLFSW